MLKNSFKLTSLCYLCCLIIQTQPQHHHPHQQQQIAHNSQWQYGSLETKQCLSQNVTELLTATLTDIDTGRNVEHLTKGGNYRFTAQFITHRHSATKIRIRLTLLIGDSEIRLPFFRKRNFCQQPSSRLHCPIRPSQFNTFQMSVHIPEQTPDFNGTLQMKLLNEKRERILCTLFPLIVQEESTN